MGKGRISPSQSARISPSCSTSRLLSTSGLGAFSSARGSKHLDIKSF